MKALNIALVCVARTTVAITIARGHVFNLVIIINY